jgi:acetyl-CoA C-acetyltransferase
MREVIIASAVRTPIGQIRGALSGVRPDDLLAVVLREAVSRAGIDAAEIEEVIAGCANQAGEDNRNVARMALLLAGLPQSVPGSTVNRLCASGLTAINQAARAIRAEEGDIYLAGGVESMTRAPYVLPKNPQSFGPSGNITGFDSTLGWRFPNPKMEALFPLEAMGETAENIYELSRDGKIKGGEITREDQDAFALESQTRAVRAIQEGRFKREIVPVSIPQRRGDPIVFDTDEFPRYTRRAQASQPRSAEPTACDGDEFQLATDMEKLGQLRAVFRSGGTVTAGNSSGLNDGAAAVVLMSASKADELGIRPLARWVCSAAAGVDPRVMGLGPIPATQKALARAELSLDDIQLAELNEAFAVQSIAVLRELGLNHEITNVNGGAIALGHPLGCSGARLFTTLIHEMHRRSELGESMRYGLVTLCVGVGQGEAAIIERI